MIVTNKYGLPKPFVVAVSKPFYFTEKRYGVTTLEMPPQLFQLKTRHDEEIEEDVSDRIWLILGTASHKVLEEAAKGDAELVEEGKYTIPVGDCTVVCKVDLYIPAEKRLCDYKVTSVWSFMGNKIKPEWEAQLNMNAAILRENGVPVDNIEINGILRDWSKGKALQGNDYPQVPVKIVKIPMWKHETSMDYIRDRVKLHRDAIELEDHQLPPCSAVDRWERPTKYAVMKTGRKSAVRVLDSNREAETFMAAHKDYKQLSIAVRKGMSARCEDYCPVKKFCHQYPML